MSMYSQGRNKSFLSQRSAKSIKPKTDVKLCDDLKNLLLNFVNHKERKVYEDLVCNIRDCGLKLKDKDLLRIVKEARGCISLLGKRVHLFVQVLLVQKWSCRSKELAEEYQGFLLDLCSAHNYYTRIVIDQLLSRFKPEEEEDPEWEDGVPSAVDLLSYERLHAVLKTLLLVIPMSSELLVQSMHTNFPYIKKSAHEHECFVYNLLRIIDYRPNLRREILQLIVTRLVSLDNNVPRSELEDSSDCDDSDEEEEVFGSEVNGRSRLIIPEAHTLDICMEMMFRFIDDCVLDKSGIVIWDKTKTVFSDLLFIFEHTIMPTFALQHVQFLWFRFISLKPALYNMFLKFLWNKFINPNVSPIIRQAAIGYTASLLSRANFIPLGALKESMLNISSWVHSYITNQDLHQMIPNMYIHGVFYSICQALFYLVAFRHKDFVHDKKGLAFLQSLNLSKVVTCQLNPLRVCVPQVVNNFAAVTRTYQLAYCYTVIEHNIRNVIPVIYRDPSGVMTTCEQAYLETHFPFDPYLLQRSSKFITPLYRVYDGPSADKVEVIQKPKEDEDDDFLMDTSSIPVTTQSFSYGSSPGFHL